MGYPQMAIFQVIDDQWENQWFWDVFGSPILGHLHVETKDGCSKQGSRTQDWTRLRKRPVDAARAGRRARHLGRILFEQKKTSSL